MDTGVNAVSDADVPAKFVQFSIDGELVAIGARVRYQRKPIRARHVHVRTGSLEQRPEWLAAVKEELQRGDAGATHRSVSGGIARMGWRALGERLRQQVAAVPRIDDRQNGGV